VDDALFEFVEEHTRKIPLADLDLAATAKANDALGVEFKLPPDSETNSVRLAFQTPYANPPQYNLSARGPALHQ
jgi:hypothetical protein